MTEIEQKALALVNELSDYEVPDLDEAQYSTAIQALCRAIEQHEQFKREVSDAVEAFFEASGFDATKGLIRFILPKPVDPLVEAWLAVWPGDTRHVAEEMCAKLHKAMETMNAKIVEAE